MAGFQSLPLKTHDGRPLPHSFYEAQGAGILLILPGLHYGPDGPALYLLAKRMQAAGWDTLGLTYGFQAAMTFPWTDHAGETLDECRAALETVRRHKSYERMAVVGKSLGTILLVQLCAEGAVPDEARVAHLTPPLGNPVFDGAFGQTRQTAYLAIGTRDSFYDPAALQALAATRPAYVRVLEGADHGLDVPGDLAATLRTVGQVVEDTEAFFTSGRVPGLEVPERS